MVGANGSSISEIDISFFRTKNAKSIFSTLSFTAPKECKKFKLVFHGTDKCTGILLIPCKTYDAVGGRSQKTKAIGIIDRNGDETWWDAIVPVNFIQTEQGKFILTLYEKRVEEKDLPFFIGFKIKFAGYVKFDEGNSAVVRAIRER